MIEIVKPCVEIVSNDMKQLLLITILLSLCSGLWGCKGCRVPQVSDNGQIFMSHTYKNRPVAFTCIEQGAATVTAEDLAKMDNVDAWGQPEFFTEELVNAFDAGDIVEYAEGQGLCLRFVVPPIDPGDYVILQADVFPPNANEESERLWSSFRYDFRNSGKTEYIWYLFSDKNQAKPGNWKMVISAAGEQLWVAEFSVRNQAMEQ